MKRVEWRVCQSVVLGATISTIVMSCAYVPRNQTAQSGHTDGDEAYRQLFSGIVQWAQFADTNRYRLHVSTGWMYSYTPPVRSFDVGLHVFVGTNGLLESFTFRQMGSANIVAPASSRAEAVLRIQQHMAAHGADWRVARDEVIPCRRLLFTPVLDTRLRSRGTLAIYYHIESLESYPLAWRFEGIRSSIDVGATITDRQETESD